MERIRRLVWVVSVVLMGAMLVLGWRNARAAETPALTVAAAREAYSKGNFKDAYDSLAPRITSAEGTDQLEADFLTAIAALTNLGRISEVDDFREKAIEVHAKNWRLLATAAQSYTDTQHYGTIISGKFNRGTNRNRDGNWVSSLERDRVRALQLYRQAVSQVQADRANSPEVAALYYQFARSLMLGNSGSEAWRLQTLTDLEKLPDYEETGTPYYWRPYQEPRGAPVDEAGKPVFHTLPRGGWETAATDGQRFRWLLMQASELSPAEALHAQLFFASFLDSQFGVQTMASFAGLLREQGKQDESGPYAVFTLKEEETIAKLANGIKRFTLPDEFNPIKIFQRVAADPANTGEYAAQASDALAAIYQNRQQYPTAAEMWRKAIARFGPGVANHRTQALEQIINNWGMFENVLVQPASGAGAKVDYRFRNGRKVTFTANEIDIPLLLADVKAYIRANPNVLPWDQINLGNIGYRLVTQDQTKYIGAQAARWEQALEPRDKHFDRRITVETPLKKAGAYLLSGQMENGNTTRIVVWVTDTVLVYKPLEGRALWYLADAISGEPIADAQLDFFAYRQQWLGDGRNYRIDIQSHTMKTDAQGQATVPLVDRQNNDPLPAINPANPQFATGLQWLAIAKTAAAEGGGGRFAFVGFANIWRGHWYEQYDQQYNQVKSFFMTDRPVYRPDQKVSFKMWVGNNKYDEEGKNPHAGALATVEVTNPRGEKIKTFSGTLDAWGGFAGELSLDKSAPLGVYTITDTNWRRGHISFRLEEYKKPEFEVKVDAPADPVMLGEKVPATITAKYYFGSPVANATVKYKVTRITHDARWYPAARWDWFYEPGYWWFAHDYLWYPGFARWGCFAPRRAWWPGGWSPEQPEIVAENEVPVGSDGTVKIEIDTAVAKAAYSDKDHKYTISAEVTDASRRTITGSGDVLVARDPFKVYVWTDRGYYQAGQDIEVRFSAQTLDNKPVTAASTVKLLKITYDAQGRPTETEVTGGTAGWAASELREKSHTFKAAQPGQYRVSVAATDARNRTMEGGYVFLVRGEGFDGRDFRFNDVELTTDKSEYKAGETVRLLVNANRADATLLVFLRPSNSIYLPPKVIKLKGKSTVEEIQVGTKDMPNFFIEAMTVADARVHTDVREVIVPPEDRILNVTVTADAAEYLPGKKATLTVKVTEKNGEPFTGATVLSLYDKAVEYISGGTNIADIRKYFWQWRRSHSVSHQTSLEKYSTQALKPGEAGMGYLGVFGALATEFGDRNARDKEEGEVRQAGQRYNSTSILAKQGSGMLTLNGGFAGGGRGGAFAASGPMEATKSRRAEASGLFGADELDALQANQPLTPPDVEPTVRSAFADTALWAPTLVSATNGTATVEVTMPENLTTWKARVWTYGNGSRVGEATTEVVTRKNLIVRLAAPRFFVEKDEVVLSAIVHNYLPTDKRVKVSLEHEGGALAGPVLGSSTWPSDLQQMEVEVKAGGERRINWLVRAVKEGTAIVRVKGITDQESDAVQLSFPVFIHGMLKTESFAGALRPNPADPRATLSSLIKVNVPRERRPEQTMLEVRYSPSLASAMVDALPYMVDYPYGCTEQTLNRFVPTVITQKILKEMKLDLAAIRAKRTNLNAQEVGDNRAADWGRRQVRPGFAAPAMKNPVFDENEVTDMVRSGVMRLTNMQLSDGGWGWFSGHGEQSFPHTTAVVVHGLQLARDNGAAVDPQVIQRGVEWLFRHQTERLAWIQEKRAERKASDMDAFVHMVLVDSEREIPAMRELLFEDRLGLAVYTKAMFGLAMHKVNDQAKLQVLLENCRQFVVQDEENQTAYLKLPPDRWWHWYGSEYEAHAYYLKLLARTDPKGEVTSRLAKYLINNRKNATYWNSTRDTAICIEALADYIRASGEMAPDMTVHIVLDGKAVKTEKITAENLFAFDNVFSIGGTELADGPHTIQVSREGAGPLYFNAYLTNFTLEDNITRAGLEIKVNRKLYKLTRDDRTVAAEGAHGQAVDKREERYVRTELATGQALRSGDLVEIELSIDSKNDYEYVIVEDLKAAGFEPVEVRSGYNGNDLNAYVEFRDERVSFFTRMLGRGEHSVRYRLRAEAPGSFSALPAKAYAMYAPELKANSDEAKVRVLDVPAPVGAGR